MGHAPGEVGASGARRFRQGLALLLVVLVSVAVALAIAELALSYRVKPLATRGSRFIGDPIHHHLLRPIWTGIVAGAEVRTNSLGLRDREYPRVKPPGVFRILMLGDSFTEGLGLRAEDSIPKQLEARLNGPSCRTGIEVINAGITSYSPILEYLLLQRVGLRLDPDLVVLDFDMSDVHDDFIRTGVARLDERGLPLAVPPDGRREAALLLPPLAKPRALRFLDPLEGFAARLLVYKELRRSPLGRRLFGTLKLPPERLEALGLAGDIQYDILAITRDVETPKTRAAWRLSERYIVGIRDLARAREIPLVLVVYPHAHQISATESPEGRRQVGIGPGLFPSERPFHAIEALGRREQIPVINLLGAFRGAEATGGPLFRADDIHHTPRGAAVFADGLLDGLLERDLLPVSAARCRRL